MRKISQLKLALTKKEADLDQLDNQILDLPPASPKFDSLAQKREDMEVEIRKLREGIEVLNAWDTLKGGEWSDEMRSKLNAIDPEVVEMATDEAKEMDEQMLGLDGGLGGDPLGAAPLPPLSTPPTAPPLDAAPLPPVEEPAPAPVEEAPVEAPIEESPAPPVEDEPITASKKNSNFQTQNKKDTYVSNTSSMKKGNNTMATETTTSKPSIKDRIAAIKQKRAEAINKEAQTRVASAWTVAKTLLPTAPASVQKKLAESLLANSTKALKVICCQTAKNAAYQKTCEAIAEHHKVTMNALMENPSVLSKEKSAVESELKGSPVNASVDKKADDTKDAGPQPPTYPADKRSEPAGMEAGNAAKREEQTIDKTMDDQKVSVGKEAAAKKACATCGEDHLEGECKMASKKTAAPPFEDPAAAAAPPPVDAAPPVEGGEGELPPPGDLPPDTEDNGATEEVVADEEKLEVVEQIDEVIQDIEHIKDEIEDNSEELNLETIFDNENLEEKEASLANNNVTAGEGDSEEGFFPSSAQSMEASVEGNYIGDMFDVTASDADPMARLMGSYNKQADGEFDGALSLSEVIKPGDAAKTFETDAVGAETRDNTTDHDDSILSDILKSLDQEEYDTTRDQTSHQKEPPAGKEAAKKSITKLKTVAASAPPTPANLASLLFGDDDF
jgi:hypothetical protein